MNWQKDLKKRVKKGGRRAKYRLAHLYLDGHGVKQNIEKAFELIFQSEKQGYLPSKNILAFMYFNGQGVKKSTVRAFKLMLSSANKDVIQAQSSVALMYLEGVGVQKNIEQAVYWACKAEKQGCVVAKYVLAKIHHEFGDTKRA